MNILLMASASEDLREIFKEAARDLGKAIALNGDTLIYGGGNAGLMGVTAQSALDHGMKVIGIIPDIFHNITQHEGHDLLTTHVVDGLPTRKQMMIAEADASVVLIGGIGTLDELFEAAASNDINAFAKSPHSAKPVIIVNTDGYFDGIQIQLARCIRERTIRPNKMKMFSFVQSIDEAYKILNRHREHPMPLSELN